MGRPRSGTLALRKLGWHARVTIERDGETVREWVALGTTSKAVARRKLAKLVHGDAPEPDRRAVETLGVYAQTWLETRAALGLASAPNERRYWDFYWEPALGSMLLREVRPSHVRGVIEDAAVGELATRRGMRFSHQTVVHLRGMLFRLFESARAEELVQANPVELVKVPAMRAVERVRVIPTDAEIGCLMGAPDADLEIQTLVLLARTVGGMRASDLNALDWCVIDVPHFTEIVVPRRKTKSPQAMTIPETVRPFFRAWWEAHGSPTSGPVFPVRRGPRAGEAKKQGNMSYADRLRREFLRAGVRRHDCTRAADAAPIKADEACCASMANDPLYFATTHSLPIDFHSTRRAYCSALARANVPAQVALRLAAHSDLKVHDRYLDASVAREAPAAAIPALPAVNRRAYRPHGGRNSAGAAPRGAKSSAIPERDTRLELATPSLGSSCSTN